MHRLASRLLAASVPAARRDDVLGDFEELCQRTRRTRRVVPAALRCAGLAVALSLAWLLIRWQERLPARPLLSALDLRLAGRLMRKQPLLTATSALALTVGVALASMGYTMLHATLWSPLPFEGGARYVTLEASDATGPVAISGDLRAQIAAASKTLAHVGAQRVTRANVELESGVVEQAVAGRITPSTWLQFPGSPLLGRGLVEADGLPGAPPVAVVGETFWRRKLAATPDVLGMQLRVAGEPVTVVGVAPADLGLAAAGGVWTALEERGLGASSGATVVAGLRLIGIREPGATLADVNLELGTLAHAIEAESPSFDQLRFEARRFTAPPRGASAMGTVMVTVLVLLLLVVAANIANLFLARTVARARELAMRTVLGAPRSQLVAQLTLEVAALGICATVLGSLAALAALRQLDAALTERPFWLTFEGGPRTVIFAAAASLLACALCGALPALRATHRSRVQGLQPGAQIAAGMDRTSVVLMVVQMSLSIALLSGALVMARSWASSQSTEVELPEGRVATARVFHQNALAEEQLSLSQRALELARRIPGVEAAGASTHLPRMDAPLVRMETPGGAVANTPRAAVLPGFFESLGARPLAGRSLVETDLEESAAPVAVVNRSFAERHFGRHDVVGERIRELGALGADPGPWREIVGVVSDLGLSLSAPQYAAGYYVPLPQEPRFFYVSLLSRGEPLLLGAELRRALVQEDPLIQVRDIQLLEDVAREEQTFHAIFAGALSALGLVALLLSLCGIYAMVSMSVTRRTREIGVRVALGATRVRLLRRLTAQSAVYLGAGAILGALLGAAGLTLQQKMLVVRLPVAEAWILPTTLAAFALAGAVASLVPASRALRIEPTEALRAD